MRLEHRLGFSVVTRNALQKDDGIWQGKLLTWVWESWMEAGHSCHEICLVLVGLIVLIHVAKDKLESQ